MGNWHEFLEVKGCSTPKQPHISHQRQLISAIVPSIDDKKPDWLIFECASFLDMKQKPPTNFRDDIYMLCCTPHGGAGICDHFGSENWQKKIEPDWLNELEPAALHIVSGSLCLRAWGELCMMYVVHVNCDTVCCMRPAVVCMTLVMLAWLLGIYRLLSYWPKVIWIIMLSWYMYQFHKLIRNVHCI